MNTHHHSHHSDQAVAQPAYQMHFSTQAGSLVAGQERVLRFRPVQVDHPSDQVRLAFVHEKQMHLIVVSRDLSYFSHLHPLPDGKGNFSVPHVFPPDGEYILFEDFTPEGADQQLGRQSVIVGETAVASPAPLAERHQWKQGAYQLTLDGPAGGFISGEHLAFTVAVQQAGLPVTDLTNYLGALAHIVIISEDTTEYLHVHPMPSKNKGPQVMAHTLFPAPGNYKVFFQFLHQEQLHTADFVIHTH